MNSDNDLLRHIEDLKRRVGLLERIETPTGASFVSAGVSRPSYSNTVALNGTLVQPFNTTEWDTDSMVDGSFNIVIPTAGVWLLHARAQVTTSGIGGSMRIVASTTGNVGRVEPYPNAHQFDYYLDSVVELVVGDSLTLQYLAGPSFTLSISNRGAPPTPFLSATYLGLP